MKFDDNSFDRLIRERRKNDERVLDEANACIAGAIKGKSVADSLGGSGRVAESAIAEILAFYHCKPVMIPESIEDIDSRLDYALKPAGIMRRIVELVPGWYKDAIGAFLAIRKDTGDAVALIPRRGSYRYHDSKTGKDVAVTSKNEGLFELEAVCFYKPFPQGKLSTSDLVRFFVSSVAPSVAISIAICAFVSTFITALIPALTKVLMGEVVQAREINLFVSIAVFLIASALSSAFINAMKTLLSGQLDRQGLTAAQAALTMRVLDLPASFFSRYGAGDLAFRMQAMDTVWTTTISVMFGSGVSAVMSLIYVLQLYLMGGKLFWPALIAIVVMTALTLAIVIAGGAYQKKVMAVSTERAQFELEMLSGVQKIKLSGSEHRVYAKWADRYSKVLRMNYNQPFIVKYGSAVVALAAALGTVVLFSVAAQVHASESTFYAFMTSYGLATSAFVSLAGLAGSIAQAYSALDLLEPLLEAESETQGGGDILSDFTGKIELSHISFRYSEDAPFLFDDLNLSVEPGEYVAVVGKTGCGKSTLMRILLGFEQPEKGGVLYDGHDISGLDVHALRQSIGVVMQDAQLLQGDLFSNITISQPDATEEEVWEALETARIADDVRAMPMGVHTMVSNGSGGLSGGQRQRIAIARAIVGKPKLLLFDEATSALDNQTQRDISEALDKMNCTRIVIAHRLSTIKQCDRVVVLDGGRIVADGSFDEVYATYLS